jgi:hypothetical protein
VKLPVDIGLPESLIILVAIVRVISGLRLTCGGREPHPGKSMVLGSNEA